MLGIIRVGHLVTVVAFDSVGVPGREAGTIRRGRAPRQPAPGAVTTNAQVARTVEILLGNGERRPENRVAARVGHHAATPVVGGLHGRVITAMAVVALVGRLQRADLIGLRARLLNIRGYGIGGEENGRKEEGYSRSYGDEGEFHGWRPCTSVLTPPL